MSSSTKLILVVVVILVGVTAAYYGFFGPDAAKSSETSGQPTAPPVNRKGAGSSDSRLNAGSPTNPRTPSNPRNNSRTNSSGSERQQPVDNPRTAPPVPVRNDPTFPPVSSDSPVTLDEREEDSGKGDPPATKPADAPASQPVGSPVGAGDAPAESPSGVTPVVPAPSSDPASPSDKGPTNPPTTSPTSPATRPTPPTPPATTRPSTPRSTPPAYTSYTVQSGDTMTSIAEEWFGDANLWDLIAKANPLVDPQRLKVGQVLNLPAKDARREAPEVPAGGAAVTYVVRPGDTLSKISTAYYGSSAHWKLIYDANRDVIGADASELSVGMKLTIPPAPATAR